MKDNAAIKCVNVQHTHTHTHTHKTSLIPVNFDGFSYARAGDVILGFGAVWTR
jgi:hypothetical protein